MRYKSMDYFCMDKRNTVFFGAQGKKSPKHKRLAQRLMVAALKIKAKITNKIKAKIFVSILRNEVTTKYNVNLRTSSLRPLRLNRKKEHKSHINLNLNLRAWTILLIRVDSCNSCSKSFRAFPMSFNAACDKDFKNFFTMEWMLLAYGGGRIGRRGVGHRSSRRR